MRKFLLQILSLFFILFIVDVCAGYLLRYLALHPKGGDNARNVYICDSTQEDILIFGSSRALHHYNPQVFADSLKMSCYNCGQDGNGVILNYGRLQLILQRYQPKMIVYDITPDYDLKTGDNHQFLGWLKGFYHRDSIADIFDAVDQKERIKMKSALYQNNSKFIQVLSDYLHPMQRNNKDGFRPLFGKLDTMKLRKEAEMKQEIEVDSLKIKYLHDFISLCQDIKLVFVVSPIWYRQDPALVEPVRNICRQQHIPLFDFSSSSKYVHHSEYFKDGSHLNDYGADEFSKDVVKAISQAF